MLLQERPPSRIETGRIRSPVIRKLSAAADLTPDAISLLSGLHERPRVAERNQDVVVEGEENGTCYLLLDGWACRYKLLPDGRRQILTFALPGDIIGLQDSVAHVADDSFAALTSVVVCPFSGQVIQKIRRERPNLSAALDWTLGRDHAILGERLLSLGRRTAFEALAHLLLELYDRLMLVGLARERAYRLPVTQEALADALGLTVVHVNRTLRKLEKAQLATVKHQRAILHDLDGLIAVAGVDPDQFHEDLELDGSAASGRTAALERRRVAAHWHQAA